MAIFPAKYNGINFSYDFSRVSERYDFDGQRLKNIVSIEEIKYLSFECSNNEYNRLIINYNDNGYSYSIDPYSILSLTSSYIVFYKIDVDYLYESDNVNIQCISGIDSTDNESIYSEIFRIKPTSFLTQNEICKITAYNNDARHGYLTNAYPAFGFFKFSKLNSDIFINKKTEYEYSYGRRKILSSENNIGKRFTFLDLTMYQQNLLKWLCNTENLFIDGIRYELISDFTELLSDENSEVKDLRADFVEAEQSFFAIGSQTAPTNVFAGEIFMK